MTVRDFTNYGEQINSYYKEYFSKYIGLVTDPYLETLNQYELWEHPTNGNGYLFLDPVTKKVVFLQDFWVEIKKHVVIWYY